MSRVLISFLEVNTRRVRTVEVDPDEHTQSPPGEDGATGLWVRWSVEDDLVRAFKKEQRP